MHSEIHGLILQELQQIESEYGVRILHAAESGSRAWGLASPDSDYDVRFVYAMSRNNYLRLDPPRDVIEWKLDKVLDINGWDLKKTLLQFARGNPTPFEWSASPIVYRSAPAWDRVREASQSCFSEKAAVRHYTGMALRTWHQHLTGETVRYKKYFYCLRPLLCARYIETYHRLPPMRFDELLQENLDPALRSAIDMLLTVKHRSAEDEPHPHLPSIETFLTEEFARQKAVYSAMPDDSHPDWPSLNACFAAIIGLDAGT